MIFNSVHTGTKTVKFDDDITLVIVKDNDILTMSTHLNTRVITKDGKIDKLIKVRLEE